MIYFISSTIIITCKGICFRNDLTHLTPITIAFTWTNLSFLRVQFSPKQVVATEFPSTSEWNHGLQRENVLNFIIHL